MSFIILNLTVLFFVPVILAGSVFALLYLEDLAEKVGVSVPSFLTLIALAEFLFVFYLLIRLKAYLATVLILLFPTLVILGAKTLSVASKDWVQSDEF